MRLRLSVQRHNLPASNIIWNVPNTASPSSYTIARLLEDVNQVLPLEAEQWGLEDYIVELAGYECLHFQNVWDTLKEDDAVSIRPLMTAEVRSRTLTGRYQISEDGRHLLDGIPFGRTYLRQPSRPSIHIPPRKRRRIEGNVVDGLEEADAEGFMIMENGETSPQDDQKRPRSKSSTKSVQFMNVDEEDEDSEDDEEFAPDDESSTSGSSTNHPDAASESDESESDDSQSNDSSSSASESSSDESSSDDDSEEGTKAGSPQHHHAPPGKGSSVTKARNRRRAASQRLRTLKEAGKIRQDATLEDYRHYLEAQKSNDTVQGAHTKAFASSKGKRKRLNEDMGEDTATDQVAELARRKQKMIADIEERSSKTATPKPDAQMEESLDAPDSPPEVVSSKPKPTVAAAEFMEGSSKSSTPKPDVQMKDTMEEPADAPDSPPEVMSSNSKPASVRPTVRLRPDTAAIGRMLLRQTKNIEKKSIKAKKPVEEAPPEPEGVNEPDFWKSRVNVSAFECWEEDYELSAPPFPFQQSWDSACEVMRENQNKNKKKKKLKSKRKSAASSGTPDRTTNSEEREEQEETILLNYDDFPVAKQDSDPTAAIENQLIQDVQVAALADDLPVLPEDMDSLSALQMSDIQVGAIIAFKIWNINFKTFTPEITGYKTAVVEKEGDSGNGAGRFRVRLANRDVPQKEQPKDDVEGRRNRNPHTDFKIRQDDEDDEDASVWEGSFADLVEPKLVQAAQ